MFASCFYEFIFFYFKINKTEECPILTATVYYFVFFY